MKFKAAVLDLDGTIVESESLHFETHKEILAQEGINITKEDYMNYGSSTPCKKFYARYGIHNWEELQKKRHELFTKRNAEIGLVDNARRLIEELQERNFEVAIVTAAPKDYARRVLDNNNLSVRFFSREDVENNKPHPEPYLNAAKELEVHPQECFVIEDSNSGLRSAKAANMFTFGFHSEYSKGQDFSIADKEINDLLEVLEEVGKSKDIHD